uniref:uncharacterized protein LOC114671009 n=1 Tax=Macaca mulatta TaxID=9544 RepID=UPI0010A22AEB|nr:uncharacterized protein LOC114671009 [Macaca mulatta]XP_028686048.1 uncharacterized protein LOC114671009 [Macaca mulatta]XP_028686049.1 uncharacterized protein LOC114671009 [Macaca mulatta]
MDGWTHKRGLSTQPNRLSQVHAWMGGHTNVVSPHNGTGSAKSMHGWVDTQTWSLHITERAQPSPCMDGWTHKRGLSTQPNRLSQVHRWMGGHTNMASPCWRQGVLMELPVAKGKTQVAKLDWMVLPTHHPLQRDRAQEGGHTIQSSAHRPQCRRCCRAGALLQARACPTASWYSLPPPQGVGKGLPRFHSISGGSVMAVGSLLCAWEGQMGDRPGAVPDPRLVFQACVPEGVSSAALRAPEAEEGGAEEPRGLGSSRQLRPAKLWCLCGHERREVAPGRAQLSWPLWRVGWLTPTSPPPGA